MHATTADSRGYRILCVLLVSCGLVTQGPVLYGSKCLWAAPRVSLSTVAPGTSCPLMGSATVHAHCSRRCCLMPQKVQYSGCELRCACARHTPASSPEVTIVRFIFPAAVLLPLPPAARWQQQASFLFLPEAFCLPPDPPPRSFAFLAV